MLTPLALRLGFEEGLFDRNDVAEWVSTQIERADSPSPALLELVPLVGLGQAEIEALLRELEGPIEAAEQARVRVDVICSVFRSGRLSPRETAARLEHVALTSGDSLPPELSAAAIALDDAFALADAGQYGTVAEAEADVIAFVEELGRPIGDDAPRGGR